MIMETVAYCVASSVGSLAVYASIQFRSNIRNAILNLFMDNSTKKLLELAQKTQESIDNTDDELGLTYEEFELEKPETEEEFLERLKFLHSKAWGDYQRYMTDRELREDSDMILYKTLLAYNAGAMKLEITSHHAHFSNGLTLWVENKYYGFGNITTTYMRNESYNRKMLAFKPYCFESMGGRYTPYTFMWLVDTIFKAQHPVKWKTMHDEYTRDKIRKAERV